MPPVQLLPPERAERPVHSVHGLRGKRVARRVGSQQGELSGALIYSIFAGWSLFSVFVYSHFSQLGDSQSYLNGAYDDSGQARTVLITLISTKVMSLLHSELLVHLAFSMFAAAGVHHLAKHARLRVGYRWPLFAVLLNPNFGVWASVIGRESLFTGLLGFFMGAVLGYYRRPAVRPLALAVLCLAGMTFIRSPYGAGLALFLAMFMAFRSGVRIRLSAGALAVPLSLAALAMLPVVWPYLAAYVDNDVLPKAKSYFTVASATTRTWVSFGGIGDLLASLWWSLPLALVGPTFSEVIARPIMLPFLMSGLLVLATTIYSTRVALHAPATDVARKIMALGWLPAITIIIVSYVPFGVYNPGSGIRYSSCFLLFLIFPSMLCSVASDSMPIVPRSGKNGQKIVVRPGGI